MRDMIISLISSLAPSFFLHQVITILCLFVFGLIVVTAFGAEGNIRRVALAFPVGLGVYEIVCSIMLICGIPFGRVSVLIGCAACLTAGLFAIYHRPAWRFVNTTGKIIFIASLCLIGAALISCSGLIPISLSNDSLYYFSIYPRYIVQFGGLRDQFDTSLTDIGLGMASIGTLPFLFGFGEIFGIQEFFHISFLTYFFDALKHTSCKNGISGRKAAILSLLCTVLLDVCTPVTVLAHWSMANMFFMEFMFIVFYEAYRHVKPGLLMILLLALSLVRMEGGMQCLFLIVCIALLDYSVMEVSVFFLAPIAVLQGLYTAKLYTQYVFDNPYVFLTPQNAAVQIGAFAAAALYLIIIQKRLPKLLRKHIPTCYILALAAGNVLLFAADGQRYIANLTAIFKNVFRQSGWGIMPYFAVAFILLLLAEALLLVKKEGFEGLISSLGGCEVRSLQTGGTIRDVTYFALVTVGYVLMSIALLWARGSELNENVGDSGNRVLLQIAPLVIFLLVRMAIWLMKEKTES